MAEITKKNSRSDKNEHKEYQKNKGIKENGHLMAKY